MLNIIRELKNNRTEMKIFAKLSDAAQGWLRVSDYGIAHVEVLSINLTWVPLADQLEVTHVYSLPESYEESVTDLLIEALENLLADCLSQEYENGQNIYGSDDKLVQDAQKALKQARKTVTI